jgi:hypothetical protein
MLKLHTNVCKAIPGDFSIIFAFVDVELRLGDFYMSSQTSIFELCANYSLVTT